MVLFERTEPREDGIRFKSNSLSGGERNRLFMRVDGNYKEKTLISGMDFREDGRGFVLFDYDNNGWLDIGVVSPNKPRFRILRNRFGDSAKVKPANYLSVQLVGGHDSSEPTTEWSPRDPFGATLKVTSGEQVRMFQLSGGEGLSSQNSSRVHIGLGQNEKVDRVEVNWPSGKTTVKENVDAGRVMIFEKPSK